MIDLSINMGGQSFLREERLLRSSDFRLTMGRGIRVHTDNLTVFFLNSHFGKTRMGITVTRHFGNAVLRNRAKRVLREAFRLNKERIPLGVDLVLLVKRKAVYPWLGLYEKELLHACDKYRRTAKSN